MSDFTNGLDLSRDGFTQRQFCELMARRWKVTLADATDLITSYMQMLGDGIEARCEQTREHKKIVRKHFKARRR